MPKVTDEYRAARRQQIIDAAYRCFARKGFHQATMRDIYAEANLSPGAVYHYFDSKDAIIQASFEFDYERSLDLFDAAIASDDPIHIARSALESEMVQAHKHIGGPRYPEPNGNCPFGTNGYLFATPLDLIFNDQTIGSMLDAIQTRTKI